MASVAPDALVEFVLGQEVEELRKNRTARIHVPSLAGRCGGKNGANVGLG